VFRPMTDPNRAVLLFGAIALASLALHGFAAEQGQAAKTPAVMSEGGMTEGDYASCDAELTANKIVHEPLGHVELDGCELAGAIKLRAVEPSEAMQRPQKASNPSPAPKGCPAIFC
jgi:hypothetical protein